MAHRTIGSVYGRLADRLNRFPQGAPPTELLFSILRTLFSEREAELVSMLPIRPFTAERAAATWKISVAEAQKVLDDLAGRALLLDFEKEGRWSYVLPPPMAGFFEFSMMRVRGDIDQKALSELFWDYISVEDDFMRELVGVGETQMGRTFVHEPALSEENALHVLDYERATEVIETASDIGIGMCYCRHKAEHLGRACAAPMEICMTFGSTASSLIRHGHARRVDRSEGRDLLQKAWDHGLVQFGENVRQGVAFICNCCGCCCEAMIAARRFALLHPIHTTNFLPVTDREECSGCGRCVSACPVEAMSLVSANDPQHPKKKKAQLDEEICLGCGVCVRACVHGRITLRAREQRVIVPRNTVHRVVMMAIERGKLHEMIVDEQVLWHHRALAAVLATILRLPPLKQAMASRQFRSRYLEAMIARGSTSAAPAGRVPGRES